MRRNRFLVTASAGALAACSARSNLLPLARQSTYAASKGWPAERLPSPRIVGEVRRFDGKRVPRGWMVCDGRTLDVHAYPELFAVIGHGNAGRRSTTFEIPESPSPELRMVIAVSGIFPSSPPVLAAAFALRNR